MGRTVSGFPAILLMIFLGLLLLPVYIILKVLMFMLWIYSSISYELSKRRWK